LNGWREAQKKGMTAEQFLPIANRQGRDNARTPFQWSHATNAGFTEGVTWMPVNPNFPFINQSRQEHDPESVLNYYRTMIRLRKQLPALYAGSYEEIDILSSECFIYLRSLGQQKVCIALNFSSNNTILDLPFTAREATRLTGNYAESRWASLQPWEAVVYLLNAYNGEKI
jgi:glycosidase